MRKQVELALRNVVMPVLHHLTLLPNDAIGIIIMTQCMCNCKQSAIRTSFLLFLFYHLASNCVAELTCRQ